MHVCSGKEGAHGIGFSRKVPEFILRVSLAKGETFRARAFQDRQDVGFLLKGPFGSMWLDHAFGTQQGEVLWFEAPSAGVYDLRVQPVDGIRDRGRVVLTWDKGEPLAPGLTQSFWKWRCLTAPDSVKLEPGFEYLAPSDGSEDLESALEALVTAFSKANQHEFAGRALLEGSVLFQQQAQQGLALHWAERAVIHLRQHHLPGWAMLSAKHLAALQEAQGTLEDAVVSHDLVHHLASVVDDRLQKGIARNNRGLCLWRIGRLSEALADYDEALEIYRRENLERPEAITLLNKGLALRDLGLWEDAMDLFQQAKAQFEALGAPRDTADAALELGWLRYLQEDYPGTEAHYAEAQRLREKAGLPMGGVLDRRASTLREMGHYQTAQETYEQAAVSFAKDPENLAHVHSNMAALALLRKQPKLGRETLAMAIQTFRDRDHRLALADALRLRSEYALQLGELDSAQDDLRTALEMLDTIRQDMRNDYYSRSFSRIHHQVLRAYVDFLMIHGDQNRDRVGHALGILENRRTFSLRRRLLTASGASKPMQKAMSELRTAEWKVWKARASEAAFQEAAKNLREAIQRYYGQRELKAHVPPPKQYPLAEFQAMLAEDEVALVFSLGEHQSYRWELTRQEVTVASLPPEKQIASLVNPLYALLQQPTKGNEAQWKGLQRQLGQILLGDLQFASTKTRWLWVADSSLHRLPPAVLLDPFQKEDWLIQHRTVCILPSLAAGLDLRNRERARLPAEKVLLAMGGAHYQKPGEEETLVAVTEASSLDHSSLRGDVFGNLPYSRAEVEAIAAMVDDSQTQILKGLELNKHVLGEIDLSAYQILHVATHGLNHPQHADLSSLELSRFNAQGQRIDSKLQVFEMQNWELRANLVVLSACRTGLGNVQQGEGVWGLSQGLMQAGASRVLVSLWPVEDRATQTLMVAFYENLLVKQWPPPLALAQAQRQILANEDTADPFYWAGFVLQGSWTSFPEIGKK